MNTPEIGSMWLLHRSIAFRKDLDVPAWPLVGPAEEFLDSGDVFTVIKFHSPHWILVLSKARTGWITVGEWAPNWVNLFAHRLDDDT